MKVELALTPEEQTQGFSGRSGLGENEGMLFVFDTPGKYGFWMKDMLFPIDMIWLAPPSSGGVNELQIVFIKKNATPESYPETFVPDQDARYVLEVPAGFSERNDLQVGDRAEFGTK